MTLFCLPYAGGSEVIFHEWKKYLSPCISLGKLELKGRGRRYGEGFYQSLDEAVDDIYLYIKNKLIKDDYAFFGHSMGSLLAFELYYKIRSENLRAPAHVFFSGQVAPCVRKKEKIFHELPDEEFLKEVIDLGGTPKELLENKDLLHFTLPLLKSDFKINEKYVYKRRETKIECDITVFNGRDDNCSLSDLLAWKIHGNRGFRLYTFEGNHFFIRNNTENITSIINSLLAGYNKPN